MSNNLDYIQTLKNQTQKKKSITITIDEVVLDSISMIADKIGVSKNQIISDVTGNFVDDYIRSENPNYYIINSNNAYMPEGHLHMLLGNRASAWGDTKSSIEGLKPGDYVFIYMNEKGIIGSGIVKSNFIVNDYSLVKSYTTEDGIDFEIWDEYFVQVEYDKTCLSFDKDKGEYIINESSVIKASEYRDKISRQPLNRTKVTLGTDEGQKLKEVFLKK